MYGGEKLLKKDFDIENQLIKIVFSSSFLGFSSWDAIEGSLMMGKMKQEVMRKKF